MRVWLWVGTFQLEYLSSWDYKHESGFTTDLNEWLMGILVWMILNCWTHDLHYCWSSLVSFTSDVWFAVFDINSESTFANYRVWVMVSLLVQTCTHWHDEGREGDLELIRMRYHQNANHMYDPLF